MSLTAIPKYKLRSLIAAKCERQSNCKVNHVYYRYCEILTLSRDVIYYIKEATSTYKKNSR